VLINDGADALGALVNSAPSWMPSMLNSDRWMFAPKRMRERFLRIGTQENYNTGLQGSYHSLGAIFTDSLESSVFFSSGLLDEVLDPI